MSDIEKPKGGGAVQKGSLAELIKKAGTTLPARTGETEKQRQRHARASNARVVLLDTSSSMDEPAGPTKTKIEMLREACANVLPQVAASRVYSFNSTVRDITGGFIPDPAGGTAMERALEAAEPHRPRQTLVITDGLPNDPDKTLEVADRMTGSIDVIFCGPDTDTGAIQFCQKLARGTGGRFYHHNYRQAGAAPLALQMRKMLALPPQGGTS